MHEQFYGQIRELARVHGLKGVFGCTDDNHKAESDKCYCLETVLGVYPWKSSFGIALEFDAKFDLGICCNVYATWRNLVFLLSNGTVGAFDLHTGGLVQKVLDVGGSFDCYMGVAGNTLIVSTSYLLPEELSCSIFIFDASTLQFVDNISQGDIRW